MGSARSGVLPSGADRWAIGLIALFTALAVAVGIHTGYRTLDVDELVYVRTLTAMHHGTGYYQATRHALTLKEGAPPSQIRSVRPPTLFLLLFALRPWLWRWVVGLVYVAVLTGAWRLGRARSSLGGALAVGLVGLWLLGAAPLLFLHAELWGLPLAIGGIVAAKRGQWTLAAVAIGTAVAFRELYGILFLFGLLLSPKRRPWLLVALGLGVLGLVHAHYAASIVSARGREAAFGSGTRGLSQALSSVSPSDAPLGWAVGLVTTAAGLVALARRLPDAEARAERMVFGYAIAMIPLTVIFGRVYWGLTYGPLLAAFAVFFPVPAALRLRRAQAEG